MRPVRFPALDGLRGVAVLLVLLAHSSNIGVRLHPAVDLSGCGRMGVFLFFVLSAYLLTLQLLGRDDLARPRTWGRYVVRRLLRVAPAYVAWVFVYFATRQALRIEPFDSWALTDVGGHLALLRGDRHLWTIPVELRWYLALPAVVAVVVLLGRRVLPAALALVAAGVALRLAFPPDYPIALGPYAPVFLVGSLAAVLRGAYPPRWLGDLLTVLALAGLVLHVPAVWGVDHRAFHLAFDQQAALCGALLLGLAWGSPVLRRPFESRPLRFVGKVSYSAYLGHVLVLVWVEGLGLPRPAAFTLFLGGSLAVGWLSHVLLERPFARIWARVAGAQGKG